MNAARHQPLLSSLRHSGGRRAFSSAFSRAASWLTRSLSSRLRRTPARHTLKASHATNATVSTVPSDIAMTMCIDPFSPSPSGIIAHPINFAKRRDMIARNQPLIERMAVDLRQADAFHSEAEAMRLLLSRPYKWGDVVALVDQAIFEALQLEASDIMAAS
jgi:hypothetical protein